MTELSPVDVAASLAGRPGRVVLHSGRDDDGCGRWSFVGCDPEATIEAWGTRVVVRGAGGELISEQQGDPFAALVEFSGVDADSNSQSGVGEAAAPVPSVVGYLGYDLGRTIERLPAGPQLGNDLPDMWFARYPALWRGDTRTGTGEIVGTSEKARAHLAGLLARAPQLSSPPQLAPLHSDMSDDEYRARVDRIRDYIRAGDVYQVNLARRLVATVECAGDPLALYAELLATSPAAYGALIEFGHGTILSGSPERFLTRAPGSDILETRPIKGTRKRTGRADDDRRLAADLAADEKEHAEHLMIVDLERNDLGKVARIGSVKVDALSYVVALPTLYHMVSRVTCELRPGVTSAEILRATFPGGSITGAPKVRAMEIIDELEPARRGPYTGAIGYLGADGAMDLSIAIRTLVLTDKEARLHVGGGIVADSTPERELEETEEKASAWRTSLGDDLSDLTDDATDTTAVGATN